jgi:two-component system CheB/CheR fusion protein
VTAPTAFPIVGIGASAGGIEALEGFFRGLPDQPGLGFVVIMHLSPERESLLHEVVGRYTDLNVEIAANGTPVEIDRVYVLPADAILGIEHRRLVLRRLEHGRRERKPIDIFFSALAADLGEFSAGVVLSGGDSDGTLGIKAIKERGGLTLAQVADGFGPQHPDMPDSAISTGLVDFAVPAEAMGRELVEFARSLRLPDDDTALDDTAVDPAALDPAALDPATLDPAAPNPSTLDPATLDPGALAPATDAPSLSTARTEIYAILRNQVGHDFSGYKTRTFMRRVHRRMQVMQFATIDAYIEHLRQNPPEVGALFRDLLINVTNFFRDAEAFEALATTVIPALFEGRGADDVVRIWVPGCATGEEVFSLGILLREQMDRLDTVPRVQIFATDIDERSLAVARAARYPAPLLDSVSPERRQRFFVADGGTYVVCKEIRDLCIFSPHSVMRDPPFSRMDLISCRNLLIYFGLDVQNQVIPTFHFALRPDGYLFLGGSESISQFEDLFVAVDKKHRIFRRHADVTPGLRLPLMVGALHPGLVTELAQRRTPLGGAAMRQAVEAQVLDRFAPAHVLINRDGDVVYYSTRTGKYLEAAAGVPTRQILTMARKGLRLDLRALLREVLESGRSAAREGISVEGDDGAVQFVNLTIEPLSKDDGGEPTYLILFHDQGPVLSREEALVRAHAAHDGTALHTERELRDTRERLQSMIEEYETALEELKSSNEELVSVNEELQSTNEELEASKEELVSLNEELHTVNAELSGKVDALDRANSDLQNLFESTDVATVFLDRNLVIRSFTPAMTKVFNILPGDRGRPLTDLATRFALPGFTDDIASVFAGHGPIERRAQQMDSVAHYLIRLAPYHAGDQKVDGVVITFVDVTSITRSEARQAVLIAELQHRTRNLLAVVQSIARQTLSNDPRRDDFLVRLAALGRVQDLIATAEERIDLSDIIRLEMEALQADPARVTMAGPMVSLDAERAQTLALALHELATNALKYGALKAPAGRLDVAWRIEADAPSGPAIELDWRESGLTEPPADSKQGFGRKLIEQALPFTLQAKSEFLFTPDGVACRIEMPLGPRSSADASVGQEGEAHGSPSAA